MSADDDREALRDRAAPKGKSNLPVILAVVFGSLFLLCGGAGTCLYFFMMGAKEAFYQEGNAAGQVKKPKVWAEAELSAAVKGKTAEQVRALLGRPDTAGTPASSEFAAFHYDEILLDGNSGQRKDAHVWFHRGVATGMVR